MEESAPLYEKVILEDDKKEMQLRVVLNEFRGEQYLHIRKYFLSFDEGYLPTREGVSMLATISNIYLLLDALVELCSKEEALDAVDAHFRDRILSLKSQ